jgi:hypothetical protein
MTYQDASTVGRTWRELKANGGNRVCWDWFIKVLALKLNKRKLCDNRNTHDCLN